MMNCVPQALHAETALPMLRFIRDTIRAAEMIPFAIQFDIGTADPSPPHLASPPGRPAGGEVKFG